MTIENPKLGLKLVLLLLIVLLAGSLTYNLFQIIEKKKADNIENEQAQITSANMLNNELKTTKEEINRYIGLSGKLDEVILEANKKISEKEHQINNQIGINELQAEENKKLRIEIRELGNRYLETIDSLLLARKGNENLNNTLTSMEFKIALLNKKLGVAEQILIENFKVTPIKVLKNEKSSITALAKRTNELEICFDLLDNKIAHKGSTQIFVRIFSPVGPVITNVSGGSGEFIHPDYKIEVPYTKTKTVDYQGKRLSICTNWNQSENYESGLYLIELSTADYVMGSTTFSLK